MTRPAPGRRADADTGRMSSPPAPRGRVDNGRAGEAKGQGVNGTLHCWPSVLAPCGLQLSI
uniref:Uncharacterized protein n=1 Tax=Arundo donax TaxID=35708 RepID=A0A0A9ERX8_ARUDO